MIKKLLFSLALLCGLASAQSFYRLSPPVPGGVLRICPITSSNPCANPAPIFADQGLSQLIPQPVMLGQDGNYGFWTVPGQYLLQVGSPFNRIEIINLAGPSPGTVTIPGIVVAPQTPNFGAVQIGTDSNPVPISISNSGNAVAVISSISLSPTTNDYTASTNFSACNGALFVGGTCTLSVILHPTSVGAEPLLTMTVNSNAPVAFSDTGQALNTAIFSGTGTSGPTFLVSVNCSGTGRGTIVSNENPPLINAVCVAGSVSGVSSNNYASGSTPTLTATSTDGGVAGNFLGGGINCSGFNPCSLTISTATTVTGSFTAPTPTFNLSLTGQGAGTATVTSDVGNSAGIINCTTTAGVTSPGGGTGCSGGFPSGTVVTLTPAPNASSTFVGWIGYPTCSTALSCVVTVNANITVTANVTLTAAPLALIQTTTNCTVASTTIACLWASAQTAGDLLMCVGAWPDASTTVSSIADTKTNTYTQVPTISPKVGTALTQVAYYAQNIVAATASANTTTMTLSGAVPAISGTNLTSAASNSSLSSYSTASITPSANNLVLLTVLSHLGASNGAGPVTSVTGNSLTWVKVANLVFGGSVGSGKNNDIEIWRAMGASPTTGAVTINYGSAQGTAGWSVSQFSGTDQTGTNGSGAIGIVASAGADVATASPMSVTMGTFGSAGNGTYGGGGTDGTANTITAGTGMTILGSELNSSSVADEWATGNISPVKENYTAGGSGLLRWGIIGVEIKVPVNRRDMRCAEYSGILASGSPIDVSAAAVGTSSTPASGSITPTSTGELITGFTTSNQSVNAVSTGFTQRIRNTFGDDMEDVTGTLAASNFQPTLSASGNWVADQIVWKLAGAPVSTNFSLTMTGSGNGNGTTTSNVGTPVLNCTSTAGVTSGACSSSVTSGSTVTMIAAPKTGSVFGGYTGITGCGPSATCQVPNITSNQNVTATFNLAGVNNFFVAPTGNDSNTGTQASPWLTLSHAIATFTLGASGTIIHVADGTVPNDNAACNPFTGISTCINRGGSSTTARLTIQCDNGVGGGYAAQGHCLVRGTGGVGFLVNTNNVDIVGFDVGAQASMNTGIFVVDCGPAPNSTCGNSVHVIGNYVHDLGNGCPSQGAIEFDQNHGYTITDGQIIGNLVFRYAQDPTASSCNVAHGIYANTGNIKIQNNIVAQVPTYGITYYSSACFGSVSNNVVISAKGGMVMGTDGIATACVNQGSNTVNNNYFARITSKGTIVLDTNCTSTTTNFLGSNMSDNSAPSGDIVANGSTTCDTFSPPTFTHVSGTNMFVNYQTDGSGDYHLKAGSPGINAGTQQCSTGTGALNPCTPNTSIDGTIRPQGPQVDVSVYEQ